VAAAVVVGALMAVLAAVLAASVLSVPVHAAPAPRRPPVSDPRRSRVSDPRRSPVSDPRRSPVSDPRRSPVSDPRASARFGPARVLLRGLGTSTVLAYAAGRALWWLAPPIREQ
jgi:hypothetical protein